MAKYLDETGLAHLWNKIKEADQAVTNQMVGLADPEWYNVTTILRPTVNITAASDAYMEATFTVDCKITPASATITVNNVGYSATLSGAKASVTAEIYSGKTISAVVTYADDDSTQKSVASKTIYVCPEFYYGISSADFSSNSVSAGTGGTSYTSFAGKKFTTTSAMTCICLLIPAYLYDSSKTYYATIGAADYPFTALDGTVTGYNQECSDQEYKVLVYDTLAAGTFTISSMSAS